MNKPNSSALASLFVLVVVATVFEGVIHSTHALDFALYLEHRTQFSSGVSAEAAKEELEAFEGYFRPGSFVESVARSTSALSGEVQVRTFLRDRLRAGSGLRLDRQGYELETAIVRRDPDVQIDEWRRAKESFGVSVVSIPVSVGYKARKGVWVDVGATLGFPLKASAQTVTSFEDAVFTNGTRNSDLEASPLREEKDMESGTRGFVPGAFVNIEVEVLKFSEIGLGAWLLSDPTELESRDAGGMGLSVRLGYRFQMPFGRDRSQVESALGTVSPSRRTRVDESSSPLRRI